MIADLDTLLAPMGTRAFFAEHWEKKPLHLTGDGGSRRALLTHAALLDALSGASRGGAEAVSGAAGGVPEGLLCFPEQIGTTAAELLSDAARLRAYCEAGHPLVWNRARGVSAGIDALAALLGKALGAHVWPNIYATGTAGTPLDVHFDAHEVIAIQCEGEKEWAISEVRVDRPIDAAEMEAAVSAALRARRDEAAARTLCTFTVRPGDLVYIPRGQFHNAAATTDRSLHVTFGIRLPTGFELARQMVINLLGEPLLREFLPPRAIDPGDDRAADLLREVAARLQAALRAEELLAAAAAVRARWASRSCAEDR